MREMIQTERDYVRSLEYIIEVTNHNCLFVYLLQLLVRTLNAIGFCNKKLMSMLYTFYAC